MRAPSCLPPGQPPPPTFAVISAQAMRVAQLAEILARHGREDRAAAEELRRLASETRRWRRLLAEAAQLLKVNGEQLEIRWRHRAVRLLEAAASGQPVGAEERALRARFELLERLSALPTLAAFEELAAREPKLLILRERLLRAHSDAVSDTAFTRWLRGSSMVHHELVELVGHGRPEFDPLCSAVLAYAIASTYLADLAVSPT